MGPAICLRGIDGKVALPLVRLYWLVTLTMSRIPRNSRRRGVAMVYVVITTTVGLAMASLEGAWKELSEMLVGADIVASFETVDPKDRQVIS